MGICVGRSVDYGNVLYTGANMHVEHDTGGGCEDLG
jgi:hypothetical protein